MKKVSKTSLIALGATVSLVPSSSIVVSCSSFVNSQASNFWNEISNQKLEQLKLNNLGVKLTAEKFKKEASQENNFENTLLKYTNYDEWKQKITNLGGDVVILNVENIKITHEGSGLLIPFKIVNKNDGESETIYVSIDGFVTPYLDLKNKFNEIVNNMVLTIKEDKKGKDIIDVVNESNWSEYIDGIPPVDENFTITNLTFDKSLENGLKGDLVVSFTYNFNKNDGEYSFNFVKEIKQTIIGFKDYKTASKESFDEISTAINTANSQSKNYLDTIIVNGESKSNWLTSFFGNDLLANQSSPNNDNVKEGFKKLFDIPNKFGVTFDLKSIKYSRTDRSLSNTQLKINYSFRDIYNEGQIIEKTETISGFFDPYNDIMYRTANAKDKDFNFNSLGHGTVINQINKYNDLPNRIKFGQATWQDTWPSYGYAKPWIGYVKEVERKSWEWFAAEKGKIIMEHYGVISENVKYDLQWSAPSRENFAVKATGPVGVDGIIYFPWIMNLNLKTIISDRRGNSSVGKYEDLNCRNVTVSIPGKNGWWK